MLNRLLAALLLCVLFPCALRAQTIQLGETTILTGADGSNAGLLLGQGPYHLSQAATVNKLSFYVATASGQLRLGIYTSGTNNNCKGGSLKAQTAAFTAFDNSGQGSWNTVNVVTPVQLPVGGYCLAYEPSSNNLAFRRGITAGQSLVYYQKSFGTLPTTFSSSPNTDPNHWSFYATLTTAPPPPPTLTLSFNPPNPSLPPTSPANTFVAQIVPAWSNGNPFTGTVAFGSPNFSDGGCFEIDGSLNLITACNLSGDGGTVQNVTVNATQ
jgi:hypothetical protein